jgi:hypothetical protein
MTKSKNYEGTKVICEYESSNLKKGVYDTETKKLTLVFNNEGAYEYDEVPHEVFASLNLAESAGKYFNANIKKNYSYRKLTPVSA